MENKRSQYLYFVPLLMSVVIMLVCGLPDRPPSTPTPGGPQETLSATPTQSADRQAPTSPTETESASRLVGNRSIRILLDDFGQQPYQGESVYYFNRLGGDRGAVNDSILDWGNGQVTTTVSSGNSWGGVWTSLNHPIREGLSIDFSNLLPSQILPAYQSQITGITVVVARGTPNRTFKLELKDGSELRWSNGITLEGGQQVISSDLPALRNINHFVWVLDHASAGDYVVLESVFFTATTPIMDTATAAFVWSYGMLLNNWNPTTGLVRDKARDASGEFDAIQATGSLAAATVVAEQLGVVTHADAVQIVGRISDTLLIDLPRFRGLWPHWVKFSPAGEITIVPDTEWSSVDSVIAAIGLLGAQNGLGMDTSGTEQMLQAIDWNDLLTPAGIAHGYTYSGDLIPYAWDVFGGESWLIGLAYAGVTGQVAPVAYATPPTANGSGFIDELAWLFVPPPSGRDYWETDWTSYRFAAAEGQASYYPTNYPAGCLAQLGLFGLSAAEVPCPSAVPKESIYQAFGVGGRFASPNDGSASMRAPVIIPHYSAMVASLQPKEAIRMWDWLVDFGLFTPLNNVESLVFQANFNCDHRTALLNQLKGSWNLSLQALGWGRYLAERSEQVPILWQAVTANPLLSAGYFLLVPNGLSPTPTSSATREDTPTLTPQAGVLPSRTIVWTSSGLEGARISAIALDPATPTTLYAGTDNGVFKSTSGGGSWNAVNTGLSNTDVRALAIDPVTPTILYAGTGGGVFKSTNGGEDWSTVSTGLSNTDVRALAIGPTTPTILYVGTGGGVFKSTNGGENWSWANTGLRDNPLNIILVNVLAIDPTAPATLYAGTSSYTYPGTWRYVRGAVFKSTNGGQNWSGVYDGNTDFIALAIDPATPTTLYTGTKGGVLKSTNGGRKWSAVNTGLTGYWTYVLAIDPTTPTTLYAGTDGGGVLRSTDSGGSWNAVNTGLTNIDVKALAIDPTTPTTLYVGTDGGGVFTIQ